MLASVIVTIILLLASGASGFLMFQCIATESPFAIAASAVLLIVCFLSFVVSLFVTVIIAMGRR